MACQIVQCQIRRQIGLQVSNDLSNQWRVDLMLMFLDNPAVSKCDCLLCTQTLLRGSQAFEHDNIAVGVGINVDGMHAGLFCCFSKQCI